MPDTLSFFQWNTPYMAFEQKSDSVSFCLDSILKGRTAPDSILHESLFKQNLLPVVHGDEILRVSTMAEPWVFVISLLLLFSICFFLKRYSISIPRLFNLTFDSRHLSHMLRDNNLNHNSSLAPLGIVCASTFSLLAYYICIHFQIRILSLQGPLLFAVIWLMCLSFYFIRNGIERMLGKVFDNSEASVIYINSNYAFNLIESILIIPLTFFLFYTPHAANIVFNIGCWALAILLVVRIIRGLQLILTYSKGIRLYLFYYLCIFEIVPILLLVKASISL